MGHKEGHHDIDDDGPTPSTDAVLVAYLRLDDDGRRAVYALACDLLAGRRDTPSSQGEQP